MILAFGWDRADCGIPIACFSGFPRVPPVRETTQRALDNGGWSLIDFHMCTAPNSKKIKIALEELSLEHRTFKYSIQDGEHLTPEFREINPNLRLPAIVDHDPPDGGAPLNVFESGSVLQYLAEKTGKLIPTEFRARLLAFEWMTWQVAGLGPMMGQAGHFLRYAPKDLDHTYSAQRYLNESRRLMRVLDNRLKRGRYLAGEEYSIADIACWPVAMDFGRGLGIDFADHPNVARWDEDIRARPAVQRMIDSPEFVPGPESDRVRVLTEEQRSNNFGENLMKAVIED